jgi:mRNA interferase MazF
MVSRGDVWLVLAADAAGGESQAPYPCVILSPPEIHDHLGVVTVAPISHGGNRAAYRVPLTFADQPAVIRLEQIRTVEKRALTRQTGTIERKTLSLALAALREMFAE